MDSVQPRTPSVRMECILASHIHNAERPRMAKRGKTQTRRWVPIGLGPIHPSHDSHVVPPRMVQRDEMQTRHRFPLE
jgi:hypothetical protein